MVSKVLPGLIGTDAAAKTPAGPVGSLDNWRGRKSQIATGSELSAICKAQAD